MKLKRRISSTAIAFGIAVQPLPVVISYAEDQYAEASQNNEDYGILRWYYDMDHKYYNLKIDPNSYEVEIPAELNGEEISKLYLDYFECPDNTCLNNTITIILPESVKEVYTEWFYYKSHIKEITLKYPSGKMETLIAADLNDSTFSYLYDEKDDDYYLGINLAGEFDALPTEHKGKKVDKLDLEHIHYTGSYEYIEHELVIPEGFKIVNKHWKGAVTGIAEITLKYPSGETEVLRSDDYDEFAEKTKDLLRKYDYDENYIEKNLKEEIGSLVLVDPAHRCTNYPSDDNKGSQNNEEVLKNNEDGIIRWFYNSDNDYIDLKIDMESYEVILPGEVNGKKIEKLYLKDLDFSNNTMLNKAPVIIIPEGIEAIDKNWKNYDTSLSALYLLYPSGEKEALLANDIHNTPFSYLYDAENDDYYLSVNVSCMSPQVLPTEYKGKKVSKIDLEHVYYPDGYENADLSLNIPDGISIVNKHWKGAVTGIAEITLKFPSGETEVLRSDDYDELFEYTKKEVKKNCQTIDNIEKICQTYMKLHLPEHPDHQNTYYPLENIDKQYSSERYDKKVHREYTDNNDVTIAQSPINSNPNRQIIKEVSIRNLNLHLSSEEVSEHLFGPLCRVNNITLNSDNSQKVIVYGIGANFIKEFKELTIGENVELSEYAFERCEELANLNVDITKDICGQAFINCPSLMKINNESPVNEDGSPKSEFKEFIEKNFYNADNIGFLNKYTTYCVKQAVNEAVTYDMPDIVKVKAIHDIICSMTSYDYDDMDAAKNHVDLSVFINHTSVCEGYARAMNLMLHEAGIESCYVNSADHAWVIVKIGDHYFHVDPTWDDNTANYDWFMKSDSQIEDNDSHHDWMLFFPSSLHSFQWDKMPECNDMMGDVDDNDIIDARDASAILSSYAKTSVGGKEEVDKILADFNFDGVVNGIDATDVLTYYSKASVDNNF